MQNTIAEFEVDVPPSANNMFVNVPGKGRVRSGEYTRWVRNQLKFMTAQRVKPVMPPVSVEILVPASTRGDIDNRCKPVTDLIVRAGIIPDDNIKHVRSVTMTLHDSKLCKVCVKSLAEQAA